ncbi:hypothetical protein IE53DRAFT_138389 [Violaceomyces palustris]|uniref:Uncharacterized protein n=1 Tax=Violaceomyces palustris TaxID=1673888 RepID=A0ACD0NUR0_9BASI|nr:hypothetical protein IE53DRAFT_138389 [Violaceomyces palustris]
MRGTAKRLISLRGLAGPLESQTPTLSQYRAITRSIGPASPNWLQPAFYQTFGRHEKRTQQRQSRSFSSTSSRCQDNGEYSDPQSDYSKPRQGAGARPWYKTPTTLVLGFIPIFTFGLGVWQIKRLKWKLSLIEELDDKLRKDPIRLPRNINLEALPDFDFRLVDVRGTFDHSRTMFLGPRVREGVLGYQVVTPMRREEGGGMVLINRGFVSEKEIIGKGAKRRLKDEACPTGTVEFTALLPRIYPPNAFTPANEPAENSWFHADPQAMAEWASRKAGAEPLILSSGASQGSDRSTQEEDTWTPDTGVRESIEGMLGLRSRDEDRVLPVLLEEVFDGNLGEASLRISKGIPLGRAATIELRNQHSVYAATWFSLSAATAVMFGILVRKGR